ncbi:putative Histone deacetylase 5 [Cocos nucifera]|uniref:Putative Histone deacetylase 5 n=1 Tax=Cocos nucifera TaxID=13894 RepID=A0A8K0ITR9_COCNU|nr:putative Histone deacetylase 5 [Cocos nucifera]
MEAPEDPRLRHVGLLYDERMCRHATPDGKSHPENPERIRAIWRKLESEGIPQRCLVLRAKEAEDKYIALVHTQSHIKLIRNISSKEFDSQRLRLASKFNSIYFNKGSSEAAYLAAGSVVEVSEKVAKGDLDSAIAIVRPPGHHAESNEAMGFCLFNNVAIAANFLLNERPELGIRKILIVDWDVHHGNGTQNMFYKDPRVLFFSIHRCLVLRAKEAEDKYIALVHTQSHIKLIRNISSKEFDSQRLRLASKFNSIYFNKGSSEAAYLAAGSVVEVSEKVAKGDLDSAIAIVRPPGHHAESNEAMGFCLFNNVAIAANFLLNERPELGIRKILIVDWDVHHGNGTQNMFYKDPRVLFFSIHRFDFGSFYPAGDDGSYCMVGEGAGAGYNINVPWEHGQCGDADYLAVWDHVLLPVAESYNPDIILISAGFDAGKIVMALEGGYNLNSIANSVLACAKVLLEEKPVVGSIEAQPFESTWRVIQEVRHELKTFWPALAVELPQKVLASNSRPCPVEVQNFPFNFFQSFLNLSQAMMDSLNLSSSSESDVESDGEASSTIRSSNFVEIIEPLSKLNIDEDNQGKAVVSNHIPAEQTYVVSSEECRNAQALVPDDSVDGCFPWRSVLSNIEVWYGSYGSNMWKPRFLCYIEGGKILKFWYRLTSNGKDFFILVIDSIPRLEQFNDILFQENSLHQENGKSHGARVPILDLSEIGFVAENKSLPLEALKAGWYSNVLYLGKEDNLPILTMTCSFSEIERFKSGELPVAGPSNNYMNTLVRGLVEGKQLTRKEAIAYINDAAGRGL